MTLVGSYIFLCVASVLVVDVGTRFFKTWLEKKVSLPHTTTTHPHTHTGRHTHTHTTTTTTAHARKQWRPRWQASSKQGSQASLGLPRLAARYCLPSANLTLPGGKRLYVLRTMYYDRTRPHPRLALNSAALAPKADWPPRAVFGKGKEVESLVTCPSDSMIRIHSNGHLIFFNS